MSKFRSKISAENVARGVAAEELFQEWLNESRLPFIYATQDLQSVPRHFRGALKRPDYLVALPFVGTIAFDVKAKRLYEGCFVFDVAEIERLILFDDIFRITTFLACLEPDNPDRSWWFRVAVLARLPAERTRGVMTLRVAISEGLEVDMTKPLQEALKDVLLLA
jgi:hypothetical protein